MGFFKNIATAKEIASPKEPDLAPKPQKRKPAWKPQKEQANVH